MRWDVSSLIMEFHGRIRVSYAQIIAKQGTDPMIDMPSRRGFLKAVGAVAAGALIVPSFSLIVATDPVPKSLAWFGSAREIVGYNISVDEYVGRIDILSRRHDLQLGVDFRLRGSNEDEIYAHLLEQRQMCADVLKREMDSHGITLADLVKLETPDDYREPAWLKARSA